MLAVSENWGAGQVYGRGALGAPHLRPRCGPPSYPGQTRGVLDAP
jgi:hypothetical protein